MATFAALLAMGVPADRIAAALAGDGHKDKPEPEATAALAMDVEVRATT